MPSAWHRDDDREYSDAPLVLPCDTAGCPGTVRIAAEDWRDNDSHYCAACVLRGKRFDQRVRAVYVLAGLQKLIRRDARARRRRPAFRLRLHRSSFIIFRVPVNSVLA